MGIINVFKTIKVAKQHGEAFSSSLSPGDFLAQSFAEMAAVVQVRQRVPNRLLSQGFFCALPLGHTLIANGPVIVADWNREDRFSRRSLLHLHDVRSGITVPMVSRGKTIGVLGAHSKTHHTFTPEDITFFQSIARLIAVGIEP